MSFRSLDLDTHECDGPQALTRSHPVPACVDFCKPRHPLPAASRRIKPSPFLAMSFTLLLDCGRLPLPPRLSGGAAQLTVRDARERTRMAAL